MYVLVVTFEYENEEFAPWQLLASFSDIEAAKSARKLLWEDMKPNGNTFYNGVILYEDDHLDIWYIPEWTENYVRQVRI